MGCEQIMTFDAVEDYKNQNPQNNNGATSNNLLLRTYRGLLVPENEFSDTIIKSNEELNDKLRNGDWGLGIGDWGLGIGPNPQSPIPI